MKTKNIAAFLSFFISILIISLLTSGGCDIDFGGGNNDGNGENGDGESILQGTIAEITPDRDLGGVTVRVEDEDTGIFFPDVTDDSGFFKIEGDFDGSLLRLEFLDETQTLIAVTSITVFPGAEVDLGEITITNGIVTFEDDIIVIFNGDVTENNCSGGVGTIEVTADDTEVIVQVTSSTDIIRNDEDLSCEDLLVVNKVKVRGELTDNIVKADQIELL
jgi:hypothetical protein